MSNINIAILESIIRQYPNYFVNRGTNNIFANCSIRGIKENLLNFNFKDFQDENSLEFLGQIINCCSYFPLKKSKAFQSTLKEILKYQNVLCSKSIYNFLCKSLIKHCLIKWFEPYISVCLAFCLCIFLLQLIIFLKI